MSILSQRSLMAMLQIVCILPRPKLGRLKLGNVEAALKDVEVTTDLSLLSQDSPTTRALSLISFCAVCLSPQCSNFAEFGECRLLQLVCLLHRAAALLKLGNAEAALKDAEVATHSLTTTVQITCLEVDQQLQHC